MTTAPSSEPSLAPSGMSAVVVVVVGAAVVVGANVVVVVDVVVVVVVVIGAAVVSGTSWTSTEPSASIGGRQLLTTTIASAAIAVVARVRLMDAECMGGVYEWGVIGGVHRQGVSPGWLASDRMRWRLAC